MAVKQYRTGLIITGDGSGGVKALKATREQIEKLGTTQDKTARKSRTFGDTTKKSFESASNSATSFATVAKTALAGVAAIFAGGGVAGKLIEVEREFGILSSSLRTVAGSADLADDAFKALENLASTLPVSIPEITEAFIKMKALGLEPTEAALISFTNTASAMGKSLGQFIEAVADASTGEFERLKEFGIKAKTEADSIAFTFQGVTTRVDKNANDITSYLQKIGDVNFAGAAAERMATLDGKISNLSDSWDGLFRTINENGAGDLIGSGFDVAIESVTELNDLIGSGVLYERIKGIGDQFATSFSAVDDGVANVMTLFGVSFDGIAETADNTAGTIVRHFEQWPRNVSAFVKLVATEFAHLLSLAEITGEKIAYSLNPANWFGDDVAGDLAEVQSDILTRTEALTRLISAGLGESVPVVKALKKEISELAEKEAALTEKVKIGSTVQEQFATKYATLNQVRDESIAAILKERDEQLKGDKEKSNQLDLLLKKYKDAQKELKSLDSVLEEIAQGNDEIATTGEKASEEYIKSWRTAGDRVASTLQNSIASGDWSGLGKTVGGIFAGSIAGLVTDSLMKTLGSDAFGAALGPVIGGVAGGVAALAISKLSDYLSGTDLDPTAQRQAAQGVGSVLGSIDAKSESIAKATDLTANAASELVNINRSMLNALQALNVGISGVVSQTARAAGGTSFTAPKIDANLFDKNLLGKGIETQFDVIGSLFSLGIVNNLGELIGKALGGKSKKVDEGIRILGGDIQSLVEGSVVDAFASFKVKKNIFDDYDLKEQFASLGDEVNSQFGLVFGGIIDSVAAGAEALGLSSGEISERLNSVILETQTISLEGLDAAAQQAEIQAVFSKVFDDTVTAVVPYLDEMQRAGEGLGETLARVSTEFELAKEAYLTLGFQIGETLGDINPALASMGRLSATIAKLPIPTELMVQAADDLISKVGGLEAFSSALTGFERNFLSAEEQTTNLSRRLGEALGDLPLPETREGFKDLLQAQDAMTEGGRENIATLLKVQGAADQYYDMLEDAADGVVSAVDAISDAVKSVGDVVQITADQAKSALQQMLGLASSNSDGSLRRLRESVGLQKDSLTSTYDATVADKNAAFSERIDRIKASSDAYIDGLRKAEDVRLEANSAAINAARDGLRDISAEVGSLSSALQGLREASLPSEMLRGQALSTLRGALSTGNLSGVGDAAGVAANINASDFSSATDFARQQGLTRNLLAELEASGLMQESAAERTISSLESQTAAIKESSAAQISAAESAAGLWIESATKRHEAELKDMADQHEEDIANLDAIVTAAESQLDLLRGIDSSIGDVATELGRFAAALENELAWQNRNQLDSAAMLAGIASWAPELKAAGIDIPGFASGGTFGGGLRLVGERGPELEVTGPSRIFSNNETRSIFDSSSIVAELKKLGARLEMLEQYTRQTTKNTGESVKYTKRWDVDGLPPERAA